MAFWSTTWEKSSSEAASAEQQRNLALVQDGVVRLTTKIGNEDTEGTLSHKVAQLEENKLDLSGGTMLGDITMGPLPSGRGGRICLLDYDGVSNTCAVPRGWIENRLGDLLKVVTGTLPDLVRQDVVLARFTDERNLKNGKIQFLGLWIERFEGEWFHSDSAQLHHEWGWRFHVFWREDGTTLLTWYTNVPRTVTTRWGSFGYNWRRNYKLYYLEFP